MSSLDGILNRLSDGQFHSGEILASELNVTRAAVWKQLKKLESMGLRVDAVRGKGYRLQQPLELLNADSILILLPSSVKSVMSDLVVHTAIDSTNRYLLQQGSVDSRSGQICLAERQTRGRGRRGRQWVSPFGSNIYLSLLWHFEKGPAHLAGLSLALGVAVIRVLSAYVTEGMGLKWPNDIYIKEKKLGGILVEISGETHGPCTLVAGVGLNILMNDSSGAIIDQPWISLQDVINDKTISRNAIAAELIEQMLLVLQSYPEQGFSRYKQEWQKWDIMQNKPVFIVSIDGEKPGVAKGVDDEGNFLLQTENGIEIIHSGEVSLRLQA